VMPREAVRLTRTISAPPAEVYRAFLEPELVKRWFAPGGFEVLEVEVDERVGGRHRTVVSGPGGNRGSFDCELRELVPGERVVMTWSWIPHGGPTAPAQPSLLTVTLRHAGAGTTELTLVHDRLGEPSPADLEEIRHGWTGALDRLEGMHRTERKNRDGQ
jgi:uncharacterized protein YndB with AHSA1/START domain